MTNEELTQKYIQLDERVVRQDEQIKTVFKKVDEIGDMVESVHKLATSMEILTREQQSTQKKIDNLTHEVEEIKEKPGKRWDTVVTVALTAIVTAVVTFALTQTGLK